MSFDSVGENDAITGLRSQLSKGIGYSSSRNYQQGSVFVERNKQVIGICIDSEPSSILRSLRIDPDDFPYLQDLVVRSTPLQNIPEWVDQFTQVENLILKSLEVPNINLDLSTFGNLSFMALPNNRLTDLENYRMNKLVRLNLNRNKFETVPEVVVKLPHLISLLMDDNYLSTSPDAISSNRLQAISLENNQLTEFPSFLRDQSLLYTVDLSKNFLITLPDWIGDFSQLQYLNLGWNRLESLPSSMRHLQKLKLLELQHNPVLDFDTSIIYGLDKLDILNLEHAGESHEMVDKIRAYQKLFDLNFVIKY